MASMPLELYQALEEEFVSMYGPLERPSSGYTPADILDLRWARAILRECGFTPAADAKAVAEKLSELVSGGGSLRPLADSPAIGHRGNQLLDDYEELSGLAAK